MFERPLIPCLISFTAGILTGRVLFTQQNAPLIFIFLLITLFLFFSVLLSNPKRFYFILLILFLAGVFNAVNSKRFSDLSHFCHEENKVIIEGTVLTPPRISGETKRFELESEIIIVNEKAILVRDKLLTSVYKASPTFPIGERIRFPANLKYFKNFNNPGRYNYEEAMAHRGLKLNASVSDGRYIVPMGKGDLGFPLEILESLRRPIRNFLINNLTAKNQALYRALILGERQAIDPQLREPFNKTGSGHILAVSGLHIGLIAWLFFNLVRWLLALSYSLTLKTDIRKLAALISCLPVITYTCITGFQVSALRAMIMVISYLISILLDREKEIWSTLALAAMIILAIDPHALLDISFQFTFLAVTGIIWLTPCFQNLIPNPFSRSNGKNILDMIFRYITGILAASISAFIFLLPVILFYFQIISFVTVPANLMSVPILGFWVLPMGLLSSLFIPISHTIAGFFLHIGAMGLDLMMGIIRFWAGFKYSSMWMVTPNLFEIILFYCLIFFLFSIRKGSWAKICLVVLLLVTIVDVSYWIYMTRLNRNMRVTFLDVGQGNSAFIQFPGKERMLIDGGGFRTGTFDTGKNIVMPFLLRSKILRVDYIVLSHPHPDHMNGLVFITSQFRPKEFWYNGDIVSSPHFKELTGNIESNNIETFVPADLSGGRNISGVEVKLLHPLSAKIREVPGYDSKALNNNSLVLKFSYQGRTILFPGDIEQQAEEIIVKKNGDDLKSDILLVPHHGSRYSCSTPFLRMVKPKVGIISSRSNNTFGFPHRQTLEKLKWIGATVMRIDKLGAVTVTVGENIFKISSHINMP